jgi:hypothetical protein
MNRELFNLAIMMLDTQDGVSLEVYDQLKKALQQDGGQEIAKLLENVVVVKDVAFLNESYVEEYYKELEDYITSKK